MGKEIKMKEILVSRTLSDFS